MLRINTIENRRESIRIDTINRYNLLTFIQSLHLAIFGRRYTIIAEQNKNCKLPLMQFSHFVSSGTKNSNNFFSIGKVRNHIKLTFDGRELEVYLSGGNI